MRLPAFHSVMRRMTGSALLLLAAVAAAQQPPSVSGNPVFSHKLELRGYLGDDPVQMYLQPKTEDVDSVEGHYRIQPHNASHLSGKPVLLAGEVSGNHLNMEESDDGKEVSGQWDGELQDGVIRGAWLSADERVQRHFELRLISVPGLQPAKK
ncbi:hypothetical protein [Undibacterium oligocarboniphilum]|uniref:CHRD domain-containing protein n=1 Tax=Undibacterium oligocarboniphilum TaxID=666702 RepID=A0A850QKT2_9BURK|nr:hypothetical protein [Undibacterium oligocarboniphilum]MBC3868785.1 hypothetical protein [Undibacterium oligocarboniphilum]NVO76766.1 hypothetical protein [Undibacterium oligocarboniphilum]